LKVSRKVVAVAMALIVIIALLVIIKVNVAAYWKTDASANGMNVSITGKTEVIGEDGEPIQVMMIAKYFMVPLAFYVKSTKVVAMRVTVSWTASGTDVDWNTLSITIKASGTGGFSDSRTSTSKTGSVVFRLPISTSQLGRTPSSGETVTWQMVINVDASIKSLTGETLQASASPITCTVSTVWYSPSFSITSSASTTTESGTSGGGCGPYGEHVIWVYGVEPIPTIQDYLPTLGLATISTVLALPFAVAIKRKLKNRKVPR